jgi:hypothetical protein
MRRRRHQLQVSTFPFLAVLLCTMGSLILLLLVLDRRAKIVALRKAHEEAAQVQAERQRLAQQLAQRTAEEKRLAAERQVEWERRQQQLHALLAQQEQDLLSKVHEVRGQVDAAGAKVRAEETRALTLKEQLQIINARLFGSQQATQAHYQANVNAAKQTEEAKRELARQAGALLELEQALANLKALRERQKQTYSLVPYFGKRGDNRRPIYVECAGSGLVFHPDRLALDSYQLTEGRVRAEVEQRIVRQKNEPAPGQLAPVPYLLMLVRPDGIGNYYHVLQALAGTKVDFGYEFVEQDWIFDFSGDSLAKPWQMTAQAPPAPALTGSPPAPPRPSGVSGGVVGLNDGSGPDGKSGGHAGNGARPGGGSGPNGQLASGPGNEGRPPAAGSNGGQGSTPGPNESGQIVKIPCPPPVSALPQMPGAGGPPWRPQAGGPVAGSPSGSSEAASAPMPGRSGPTWQPAGGATAGPPLGPPGEASLQSGTPASPGSVLRSSADAASPPPPTGASSLPSTSSISGGMAGNKVQGLSPPLGRLLGNRDWIIFVECSRQAVVVKQGKQRFTVETLEAAPNGPHPLTEAVRQMIARRQATVRAGEPPFRPMLRFQVQPEGLRTYYLAYPLLAPLGVPMARENVE